MLETFFGQADCRAAGDDDVIEDADVDETQGVAQPLGDGLVGE